MKFKPAFLLLLLAVFFFFGCKIEGTVSEDGVGIPRVRVTIKTFMEAGENNIPLVRLYTTYTDNQGLYVIEDKMHVIPEENFVTLPPVLNNFEAVTFSKPGYKFKREMIEGLAWASKHPNVEGVNLTAPGCFPDDAIISSEETLAEISAYQVIGGNLIIRGSLLKNIDALSGIRKICGDLIIESNDELTTIHGLSAIEKVWGSIEIKNNAKLENIDCFKQLISASNPILISNNSSLKDLQGLSFVYGHTGTIKISSNSGLETVSGLCLPDTYDSSLSITDNPMLTDLKGLVFPKHSESNILISGNPGLKSLEGLEEINSIDCLSIRNTPSLVNLHPLKNLKSIGGYLSIKNNHGLKTLEGLENLSSSGNIYIEENHSLVSLKGLSIADDTDVLIKNNTSLLDMKDLVLPDNFKGIFKIHDNGGLETLSGLRLPSVFLGSLEISRNNVLTDIELPNVTAIEGRLTIGQNEQLESLEGLSDITTIDTLIIRYTPLQSLNGLHNLIDVQDLVISGTSITSLSGLNSLETIVQLQLYNNDHLETLDGFDSLVNISESVDIYDHPELVSIKGLSGSLDSLHVLNIAWNKSLTNLEGINSLRSVSELNIRTMPELTNIEALSGLISVDDTFNILFLDKLTSLSPLSNLENVSINWIKITNNDSLESLEGLEGIIRTKSLEIANNKNLQTLMHLESLRTIENNLNVTGNASLKDPGLGNLKNLLGGGFIFRTNPELCTSLINDLKKQLSFFSRIVLKPDVSENKMCL